MSKLAFAGGHSKKAPGACSYLDEYTEDRKINTALVKEMRGRGHKVTNCSNEASSVGAELALEVSKANKSGAKVFSAHHLNCCTKTRKPRGVEVWYYKGSKLGKMLAEGISERLAAELGLPNRGAKATTSLYVLRHTDMTAVLVEFCFVDSKADAAAYRKVGASKIAKVEADAIEAVLGKAK